MYDVIIVGAGVIGTALARALIFKKPQWRVAVLEKEDQPARHTSGRNSGVVHAGFNQKPGTLKAKFCVDGNRRLREFCQQRDVALKQVGTLVVASRESQITILDELFRRGQANGVEGLKIVTAKELKALEPNAGGLAALHAPTGSIIDNAGLVLSLAQEAKEKGVEFYFNFKLQTIKYSNSSYWLEVFSLKGHESLKLQSKIFLNCAGLYADQVAHLLGAGLEHTIIPFRGEYYKAVSSKKELVNSMLYPIPDLKYPFLGVHWTKKITGDLMIGPNAVLAFGRESYAMGQINIKETLAMVFSPTFLRLAAKAEFIKLAADQLKLSLNKKAFVQAAQELVPTAQDKDFLPSPLNYRGNRAQLVNNKGELVDDIVVERANRSLHVLNAVSPGFTCALPFADYLVEQILNL